MTDKYCPVCLTKLLGSVAWDYLWCQECRVKYDLDDTDIIDNQRKYNQAKYLQHPEEY